MSRGKKLDLFIGANIEDGWAEVQSPQKSKISKEILEPQKHFLVFKREKRRGKVVTLVGEFHLSKEDATKLLKSLKKRDLNSKMIKRRGKVYIINKVNPKFKARQR